LLPPSDLVLLGNGLQQHLSQHLPVHFVFAGEGVLVESALSLFPESVSVLTESVEDLDISEDPEEFLVPSSEQ
jgi:ABC-type molybdate transport system permease subunit